MKDRVKIPIRKPADLCALLKNVTTKHMSDGDQSPLRVLKWQGQVVDKVVVAQDNVERLKRELAEAYQQRKLCMEDACRFARSVRDVLTGAYPDEMKTLGQWGFTVLDPRTHTSSHDAKQPSALLDQKE